MKIRENKGSMMIEAVMIFPIVILSIAAIFTLATQYYISVENQVEQHLAEREENVENGRIDRMETEWIRVFDAITEELE